MRYVLLLAVLALLLPACGDATTDKPDTTPEKGNEARPEIPADNTPETPPETEVLTLTISGMD
jgi:hypothetical protein